MSKGKKTLIIVAVAMVLVLSAFYSTTGFYVVTPFPGLPGGETIYYNRRGSGLPFVASADSLNIKHDNGVSEGNTMLMNSQIAALIEKRVILKLGYSKSLYMFSTGNKDFTKPQAPLAPAKP